MTETIQVLEPVLFTKLSEEKVYQDKPSYIHILVGLIAIDMDLKLKIQSDYEKALAELIKQVKYN